MKTLLSRIKSYRYKTYIRTLMKHGLKIGNNTHILDGCFLDPSHCYLISLGDNCTISPNVRMIAHDASTKKILGFTKMGRIDIKDDCFIGDSAIILPNTTIGPRSIVGAGSVVTKNVPPNMIAAGNPARIISSVEDYIKKIRKISAGKKIYPHEYSIENLDEVKRSEIIRSIGETMGFIV